MKSYVTQEDFAELKGIVSTMAQQIKSFTEAKTESSSAAKTQGEPEKEFEENIPISQLSSMTQAINELRQQNQDLLTQQAKDRRAAEYKEIENFVENQIRDRRVLPKERKAKIDLLKSVPDNAMMNYTDSHGKTFQKSSRQVLMEDIMKGPQLWNEGEFPAGSDFDIDPTMANRYSHFQELGADIESIRLDTKIREFASFRGWDPDDPDMYSLALNQYTRAAGITL